MARNVNNHLARNYTGKVGKDFVLKDLKGETILKFTCCVLLPEPSFQMLLARMVMGRMTALS
jgi:hypothetical protein